MNNEGVGAPMHAQTSNVTAAPRRRVSVSLLKWLVHISRFGLVALFLFTAGAKLAIVKVFAANVAELVSASGFDYRRWMWPATIAVIVAELITAALLLIPSYGSYRRGVCWRAAAWFAGFALYTSTFLTANH